MSKFELTCVRQLLLKDGTAVPISRDIQMGYYDSEDEAIEMMATISPKAKIDGELIKPIAIGEGAFGPYKAFSIPYEESNIVDLYTISEIFIEIEIL